MKMGTATPLFVISISTAPQRQTFHTHIWPDGKELLTELDTARHVHLGGVAMKKTVQLALNKYPTVPSTLMENPNSLNPAKAIDVDMGRLFHHYYLDTRGYAPPSPDLAQFEHLQLLAPCPDLRVLGSGFGINAAFKKHRSNELGQAFCRWFLYEHIGITYFAHMEAVLDRAPDPKFGVLRVERVAPGDAPDYLCTTDAYQVFLGEAKGRVSSVSFSSADFAAWRKQFNRVVIKDAGGGLRSVKGHIVATRFATEAHPNVKSTLFAEDPQSPGDRPLVEGGDLGAAVIALHYSDIAAKIRQPLLSGSLASGVTVPPEIQFPAIVWELRAGPLQGKRFVGGYFPGHDGGASITLQNGKPHFLSTNPFRLDIAPGTFFGVEERIFEGLCAMARNGDRMAGDLNRLPDIPLFDSSVSILRDGSVVAPVQYFDPIGFQTY